MEKRCNLCPRNCGVNRKESKTGVCGQTNTLKVARAALHPWEEPCISGENGSGTVFFSGCNLGCIFCQNQEISRKTESAGEEITTGRLAEIFLELQAKGAHNINLVTPTHFILQIKEALILAKERGLFVPVVYNTSGYEKAETLRVLDGLIDIYLPDMKYMEEEKALHYSLAKDYPEVAKEALAEMYRQVGPPKWEGHLLKKGMIVRHLVLPLGVSNAKKVLRYLYETYQSNIFISIMNQYTPPGKELPYPELNRKVTKREYEKVLDYAISLGITNAFIQEGETAKESFIPAFNGEGVNKVPPC